MALSSGTRSLLGEAASWVTAAAVVAACLIYYNDIRSNVADGLRRLRDTAKIAQRGASGFSGRLAAGDVRRNFLLEMKGELFLRLVRDSVASGDAG